MNLRMLSTCMPGLALAITITAHATAAQPPSPITPLEAAPVDADGCPVDGYGYGSGQSSIAASLRSWTFRRYSGSVEMQDKVFYPRGYYGQYYFRGWKPDWVYPNPPSPNRDCDYCDEGHVPFDILPTDTPEIPESPEQRESRRNEGGPWGAKKKTGTRVTRLPTTNPAPQRTKP